MRASGVYAEYEDQTYPVAVLARDYVQLATATGPRRVEKDDLDDLVQVSTSATWHGERVSVTAVEAESVAFLTNSGELATAQALSGDQYSGWFGSAPLAELSEVSEKVVSIHPRGQS